MGKKQSAEWIRKRTECRIIDLAGQRFGRLVVIQQEKHSPGSRVKWSCSCDCGGRKIVATGMLRRGHTQSCGCIKREQTIERNTKHGLSRIHVREYRSWKDMRARCHNEHDSDWKDYGGRGISICAEWEHFEVFFADMGPRPAGFTLDRIDVNGHYEPGNCRWADARMQGGNKRNTHRITIDGETKSIMEWSRIFGIDRTKAQYRLKVGMDPKIAFSHADFRKPSDA